MSTEVEILQQSATIQFVERVEFNRRRGDRAPSVRTAERHRVLSKGRAWEPRSPIPNQEVEAVLRFAASLRFKISSCFVSLDEQNYQWFASATLGEGWLHHQAAPSWCFSAICMMIIIIMLWKVDGEALPKWKLGISINAFISIFSGFAKSALLLPTAEALGQLKWSWFTNKRRMLDFEVLDSASRGP